jgi:signal transduction histidine kinase
MQANPSTRQLLRHVYLLCAVSAITCAGLVAVFSWRHLQQHQLEARQTRVHTKTLEHIASLQAQLLNNMQHNPAGNATLLAAAQALDQILSGNEDDQVLAACFRAAWQTWVATYSPDTESAMNAQDPPWSDLLASLEAIRIHHGHSHHQTLHQHSGEAGSITHLWLGAILLGSGIWGVIWLVTLIARSQQQLLHAQESLERRVAERTSEISRQNARLTDEVTQRRQLQQEILTIASEEQRRIAGWLHDDLGQRLTGLSLGVKTLERELESTAHTASKLTLAELSHQVRATSETLRTIVRGLYPTTMTQSEFVAAVNALAKDAQELANCRFRVQILAVPELHDESANVQLYGILREAVTNTIRHACAQEVRITVAEEQGQLVLTVSDDGCGFETELAMEQGVGIKLMHYRTDILRGNLEVTSHSGAGTTVRLNVPLPSSG